jgi:hypothetical protein
MHLASAHSGTARLLMPPGRQFAATEQGLKRLSSSNFWPEALPAAIISSDVGSHHGTVRFFCLEGKSQLLPMRRPVRV